MPDRALARHRERIREDRGGEAVQLVAEHVVGRGRDRELPAPADRDRGEDDPVVPVEAVVRREEDRTVDLVEMLATMDADAIEERDERPDE